MVPLHVYTGQVAGRQQRLLLKREERGRMSAQGQGEVGRVGEMRESGGEGEGEGEYDDVQRLLMDAAGASTDDPARPGFRTAPGSALGSAPVPRSAAYPPPNDRPPKLSPAIFTSLVQQIDATTRGPDLYALWQRLQQGDIPGQALNVYLANKVMSAALTLELPELAVNIFEDSFGYYYDPDPAKDLIGLLGEDEEGSGRGGRGGGGGRRGRERLPWAGAGGVDPDGLFTSELDVMSLLRGDTIPTTSTPTPFTTTTSTPTPFTTTTTSPTPTTFTPTFSGADGATGGSGVTGLSGLGGVGGVGGVASGGGAGKVISFKFLVPNNHVCTTAVKAYGRRGEVDKVGETGVCTACWLVGCLFCGFVWCVVLCVFALITS